MKNNLNKVVACFEKLDFKPDITKFQDRIIVQKVVFLLKNLGVGLDYDFSLYVKGPYSPALTREIYADKETMMKLKNPAELTKKEKEIIEDFKEVVQLKPTQLEIIATYAYLAKICKMEHKDALISLKKLKPFFSDADIAIGISRYKELFYKPTAKELKEMKDEFKIWDRASDADFSKFLKGA